jgi:hypothetical protein
MGAVIPAGRPSFRPGRSLRIKPGTSVASCHRRSRTRAKETCARRRCPGESNDANRPHQIHEAFEMRCMLDR